MTEQSWSGTLTDERELVFAQRPEDPEMRESSSIWLFEENGRFGFPRIGIEAQGKVWDEHRYDVNMAWADGRVMKHSARGETQSAIGADGRPTILGVDGLAFEMIEPFRKWVIRYDGEAGDFHIRDMITDSADPMQNRKPVSFVAELEMVTPCWVQDNTPERVATMTDEERADAESMGVGWRLEHQFRATGQFTFDGETHDFKGQGNRIKRQSVRPMAGFRGHVWQAAVFPDGTAFGYIAYPPDEDGNETYNDGYVYIDGVMKPAKARNIPWLRKLLERGDNVAVTLDYDGGSLEIHGETELATFKINNPDLGAAFDLQQSGVRYTLGDQVAYGMIERSSFSELVERPA